MAVSCWPLKGTDCLLSELARE